MPSCNCKIKSFVMKNGERYCLLVSKASGLPYYYPNLFLITQVRNRSLSTAAMESTLASLNVLMAFNEKSNVDIEVRFLKRLFLQPNEMDAIRDYCQLNFSGPRDSAASKNVLQLPNQNRQRKKRVIRTTDRASTYNRLTHIAHYSKWLAETLLSTNTDKHTTLEIEKMYSGLKARRPPKKCCNQAESEEGLSREQIDVLLEVVQPGSERNPFHDPAIQVRNQVIILLLLYLGIRGGELLNIRVRDISFSNNQIVIARRADDKSDPRIDQPLVKTLDRRIPMKPTLVSEIHNYILHHRNKVPRARKHDYLFITHKAGPTQGQPMSRSAYEKLIALIAKSSPELSILRGHGLRHTWNDSFSRLMDEMENPPSPEMQEQQRSYLQGWKSGSGSAAIYTKRHIKIRALEAGLQLQERMSIIPKNLKND
ncbi:site-specific integrase [Solimicrobium silvestre]|uniref:Phage integrase family n=1 Tax=Solimicrobium silvestre TaxID=2099400 RepID=A0A2S9H490_9BURK|nr:site-specific integrase [Solimicrobium silvestre]PRC94802.1 Phage integrase family [Solimicrobium silvestre]